MEIYELIIYALIGLAVCFFGYKIKKFGFFVIWFLLGYNLISFLLPTINSFIPQIAESDLYQFLLPIAGGLLLGLVGFSIEKICVSGIVLLLTILIGIQYFGISTEVIVISAIVGAVLGAIAIALIKPAIILSTAVAGAYALTLVIISIFTIEKTTFFFPILAIIAALGAIFQFSNNKDSN